MMVRLFGIDIAQEINRQISPGLLPLIFTKVTPGTRTTGDPTAGTNPGSVASSGKGFTEDYKDSQIDGTLVKRGDRQVLIIALSLSPLATPEANDLVSIENTNYKIVRVKRDPAGATFRCQARKV